MATMVENKKGLRPLLRDLVTLDCDALGVYQAAAERLYRETDKAQLNAFLEDHRRHASELSGLLHANGEPSTQADTIDEMHTAGKVVLSGVIGEGAIFAAMNSIESDTNGAYEGAMEYPGVPDKLRALFERFLADERVHKAYFESRLSTAAFEPESPGTHSER